ncbi:hypothetical protein HPB48_007852 [Haemaphysalis longicornis]|uniref:Uncharacterized protein n=1 Tax=Haemaphysalis longicornis TaxID=44386 RepID=A0A9J6GIH5_HAELO|nr:hypothetical protein HPB48_007852 [Haemaphysalis longicornis]
MPPTAFQQLYTALVLPVMEYCSAIWLPHSAALHARLASVQRRAAYTFYSRSTPKSQRLSYTQMQTAALLQFSSWQPLMSRIQAASIRLLCRLFGPRHHTLMGAPRLNRPTKRLEPLLTRTERHSSSWLSRAVALWRQLPADLVGAFPPENDDIRLVSKAPQRLK